MLRFCVNLPDPTMQLDGADVVAEYLVASASHTTAFYCWTAQGYQHCDHVWSYDENAMQKLHPSEDRPGKRRLKNLSSNTNSFQIAQKSR